MDADRWGGLRGMKSNKGFEHCVVHIKKSNLHIWNNIITGSSVTQASVNCKYRPPLTLWICRVLLALVAYGYKGQQLNTNRKPFLTLTSLVKALTLWCATWV